MLAGFTPFVMGLSAIVSIFETSGALPAIIVSVYTGILAGGVIIRGLLTDWAGVFLLAGDGAIRVIDSALTFAQRGFFFLGIGLLAAVICYFLYLPSRKKAPVHRDRENQGEEGSR